MNFRFISNFIDEVRDAHALRQQHSSPRSASLVFIFCILIIGYITASILIVPYDKPPEFNFATERGTITVLSAIFLAMGCAFAFVSFLIFSHHVARHRIFWLLMTIALGFLAMDELLQFHERIGDGLDRLGPIKEVIDHTPVRRGNDVIVILYGIFALPAVILFLPSILRFPKVIVYFWVGCFFYIFHTAIDSLLNPPTLYSIVLEESAKLFCSFFLAVASLVGLLGIIERFKSSSTGDPAL